MADTRDIMTKRSSVIYGMRDDDILKAVLRFNSEQVDCTQYYLKQLIGSNTRDI